MDKLMQHVLSIIFENLKVYIIYCIRSVNFIALCVVSYRYSLNESLFFYHKKINNVYYF